MHRSEEGHGHNVRHEIHEQKRLPRERGHQECGAGNEHPAHLGAPVPSQPLVLVSRYSEFQIISDASIILALSHLLLLLSSAAAEISAMYLL